MSNLLHRTLGSCELIQFISKGAMGEIYLAIQPLLNRKVAVKVIQTGYDEDPNFIQRFKQEAQALAALEHPHIVTLYEYGYQDEIAYLVMPYIAGGTLKERLKSGTWSLAETINLLEQLASALDFAHQRSIIHRDIKPANVLLRENNWPLLADFGVAKLINNTAQSTHGYVGTPLYMAPEQWLGQNICAQTDIYALGIMFYEIVAGTPPFTGDGWGSIMLQHLQERPRPIKEYNANAPEALEPVIQRALAKEPSQRFTTAREFAEAAKQAIVQSTRATTIEWSKEPTSVSPTQMPTLPAHYNEEQEFIRTGPVLQTETLPGMSVYTTANIDKKTSAHPGSGTLRLLTEWKNLFTAVDTIALLPDVSQVISSALGTISLWKPGTPQAIVEVPGHTRTIWASAITFDGKTLATGSWDRSIRLWNIEQRRLQRTIIGHSDIILTITLAMNDRVLLSGSRDGTIRIWELPGGRQIRSIRHPGGPVWSLLYLSESDMLAAGADNGLVGLWNLKNGQLVWKTQIEDAGQIVKLLVFDAQHLLCLTKKGDLILLNLNSGIHLPLPTQLPMPAGNAIALKNEIVYSDKSGILYCWNTKHNQQHLLIQAHQGRVTAMAARPELRILATGGEDHSIKLWQFM
ncbi:MAG: WD40 repeat domain-containing serine/threonine protein kinase [Ktedonobacteraceae bacterium]